MNRPKPDDVFARDFWNKTVLSPSGCWEWTGIKDKDGYGYLCRWGKNRKAHRVAWLLVNGAWPVDLLCHRCDNPSCVRPSHMFEGTIQDNRDDMMAKGRQTKGERNGRAKLTEEEVQQIRSLQGRLSKAECARLYGVTDVMIGKIMRSEAWFHL